MTRQYDPAWPFPQYDELGQLLTPESLRQPGPRATPADIQREMLEDVGEALL